MTLALLAVLFLALAIGTRMSIKSLSPMPTKLGLFYGRFQPCPDSPNCVSTMATDDDHKIEPIPYDGVSRKDAYGALRSVIDEMPRSDVQVSREDYVHVEFRSKWFGYFDDAEFSLNDSTKRIEMRSAARLGKNDLGVNRARLESIRARMNEELPKYRGKE
jgi:uncharacterized protein (DUF1499 family)